MNSKPFVPSERIVNLRHALLRAKRSRSSLQGYNTKLSDELDKLKLVNLRLVKKIRERTEAMKKMREYVQHKEECSFKDSLVCDCGLISA